MERESAIFWRILFFIHAPESFVMLIQTTRAGWRASRIVLLGFCLGACGKSPSLPPPNVLIIVADDLGWSDLSCYGNAFIETPRLDHMAAQGARFTDFYAAAPLCSPTRASVVSGRYPARLNLTEHIHGHHPPPPDQPLETPRSEQGLPFSTLSLGELAGEAGYTSAHIGKWHLGGGKHSPENHGFDHVFGGSWAGLPGSFFFPFFSGDAYPELKAGRREGDYLTDVLTDEAVRFISGNKDQPFLLHLCYYAPHVPIEGPADLVEKYRRKRGTQPDSLLPNVHYAAMVEAIDRNVGRILDHLDSLGLAERTLVMFVSDNGGLDVKEVPAFAEHTPPTTNAPLRAGKGYLYEGGIREPFIVAWPGVVKSGSVITTPAITNDIWSTAAHCMERRVENPDGISLWSQIQGEAPEKRPLFWHFPHYSPQGGDPGAAIRSGNYKLIEWAEDRPVELYHLNEDIGETHNLAADEPGLADSLLALLHDWQVAVDARMTRPNPNFVNPKQ